MQFKIKKESIAGKFDRKILRNIDTGTVYLLEYIGDSYYNLYTPDTYELSQGNVFYDSILYILNSTAVGGWVIEDKIEIDDKGGGETEDN